MVDSKNKGVSVKISDETYDKLAKIKEERGASITWLITKAVELLVEKYGIVE